MSNSSRPKAAIIGYGETPVSRGKKSRGEPQLITEDYLAWAAKLTLEHASLTKEDLNNQGLAVFLPFHKASVQFHMQVSEILGLTSKYLTIGYGLALVRDALNAVAAGVVDKVLILGGGSTVASEPVPDDVDYSRKDFETAVAGMQGPNTHFAMVQRRHMQDYGTKLEHLGKIATTQRYHATLNPNAIFQSPLTLKDYLASPLIADPMRLYDIVMRVNGGIGVIVASVEAAKKASRPPVYLIGSGECDNYYHEDMSRPDITYMGIREAAKVALKRANVSIRDLDFFEPYDDYSIAVLMQLEDMGFCEKGKGGKFVEETDLTVKGQLPLNTGGGQLSAGQVISAASLVNLVEGIRQLMGEGGKRQVNGARIGAVTEIAGMNYGRNICNNVVGILSNEA